ncbi:hypothetical protein [Bacillus sp. JCM 19034]|uniref:hypothetical protein n=1 Tax=Bacillus sp. JCM 19034 TaxID=1481928 RepID=UPI0007830C63|nr:hypothetical protein [Bacillus sp. JCM 19034]
MEFLDAKKISSSWSNEIFNYKKLSERATLILTLDEKFIIKSKDNLEQFNRDNNLFTFEEDDTETTANYSYIGYEFLSKILFEQNTKNTLTLESTPMVF